jgi:hypothetical protein
MARYKYVIRNAQSLWNHQSIEVRGKIYSTGGAVANTKIYLNHCHRLNEDTFEFEDMTPMKHERDVHGICGWRDRYIICVGSWHGTGQKTCEIYDV